MRKNREKVLIIIALILLSASGANAQRSVKLDNYNQWYGPDFGKPTYNQEVAALVKMDRINFTEYQSYSSRLTPDMLRQININAKVFRLYNLAVKSVWDTDWNNPINDSHMQIPMTKKMIEDNDWWLYGINRTTGEREVAKVNNYSWALDVGKPGFKEAFLKNMLERNRDEGFDGFVFDCWYTTLSNTWIPSGYVYRDYPNPDDWFNNAWKPFVRYVSEGLRDAGYTVVGNCVGEYNTQDAKYIWQRSQVDAAIYEQWAVNWEGNWLPGSTIEARIKAFNADPLEVWTADYGLQSTISQYQQKADVALAMYYIAMPTHEGSSAYFHFYNTGRAFWYPLWDLDIGVPAEGIVQPFASDTARRYFWKRKYTKGIVLLNYNSASTVSYKLDRAYRNLNGDKFSGSIAVPPYSALVLVNNSNRKAWSGIDMVAVPLIPDAQDPKQVVGFSGNSWLSYKPDSVAFKGYPDRFTWFVPADVTPGRGFWAKFDGETPVPAGSALPQDQPVTIHLSRGWNLIGQPFLSEIPWDWDRIMIKYNGSTKSLRDSGGILWQSVWGWAQDEANPYQGSYYIITDASVYRGLDGTLEPWKAYWVMAYKECDLILPPPAAN